MSAIDIVIASAKRTAVGSFNGAFANTPAHELGAVLPSCPLPGEPQVRLVDQGCGLQGVAVALLAQEVRGQPLELVVNQRNQFRQGLAVAVFHFGQQHGYLARGILHRRL